MGDKIGDNAQDDVYTLWYELGVDVAEIRVSGGAN